MADLVDRIAGINGADKISVHHFTSQYRLVAEGIRTPAEVVAEFNLVGQEVTDASAVLSVLDAQSNALNKVLYILKMDAVFISVESGDSRYWTGGVANKSVIKADLDI